jgi:hypothetical protein
MEAPIYKPKCPVCSSTLEGVPIPMPIRGRGRCPEGNCYFDFETDHTNKVTLKDKDGNLVKSATWKLQGNDTHE